MLTFATNGIIHDTTPELPAILKSIIINHLLCISYAGNVEIAKDAIGECLKDKNRMNLNNILKILLNASKKDIQGEKTKFTYCLLKKNPVIGLISEGKIDDYTDGLLCLGPPDAITHFKQKFTTLIQTIPEDQAFDQAFNEIIKNPDFPTIGYLHICVKVADELPSNNLPIFGYKPFISMEAQNLVSGSPNEYGWRDILLTQNSIPKGISCFVSKHPKYFAIAFHFIFEKTGILFCPQLNLNAIWYPSLEGETFVSNSNDFLNKIKEKYDIPMQGFAHVRDTEIEFLDTQDRDGAGNIMPIKFTGFLDNT